MHSDLLSILCAGVLAPSADNRHCFELEASNESIRVFGNEAHLSAPYYRKVLDLISFGAVTENMRVRAARLGYRTDLAFTPDPARPSLIAEMRLMRSEPLETPLDAAIATRHTNRRLVYGGPALTEADLRAFSLCLQGVQGVGLAFYDSAPERAKLLRLMRTAEAERFNTRALHHDLFTAVRFDVGWHSSANEGLAPGTLCVEPGMRWAFSQLRHWPLMNALRRIRLHRALGFRAADLPCRFAPHCGVLSTSLPAERGAIAVGIALERLWLQAESRGLAFQPFAGAALLALAQYTEVPRKTGEWLRKQWKELSEETPLMIFRMGYASRPAVRTGRPTLEAYLRR